LKKIVSSNISRPETSHSRAYNLHIIDPTIEKKIPMRISIFVLTLLTALSCTSKNNSSQSLPEVNSNFSTMLNGQSIQLFTLINGKGMRADITNYGGKVVALLVPDRDGLFSDIVQGFDDINGYINAKEPYFGALIGRYGNRIANGKFSLDGREYTLATNNGSHHLHGGPKGFHAVVWEALQKDEQTLELSYLSQDEEEGYPGNLQVKVVYQLTEDNVLRITYEAETDAATVINLTHHSFFNLSGNLGSSINDHILKIYADAYTPVDEGLIPTGVIELVDNTPFDFRRPRTIGKDLQTEHPQLLFGKGYDHNFVLSKKSSSVDGLRQAATVIEPQSGRVMDVWTSEPGLQFYGGNFLNGEDIGKGGIAYPFRSAFCLETQHFPDSPNHPTFPSTILKPGEVYKSTTEYRFDVR
jgi:aldose 1-epimerase